MYPVAFFDALRVKVRDEGTVSNNAVYLALGARRDGRSEGFPEVINTVLPETTVQTCIVHLIRNSLNFASWKDRNQVASEPKQVYRAPSAEAAALALEAFDAAPRRRRYSPIAALWRRAWEQVIPLYAFAKSPLPTPIAHDVAIRDLSNTLSLPGLKTSWHGNASINARYFHNLGKSIKVHDALHNAIVGIGDEDI